MIDSPRSRLELIVPRVPSKKSLGSLSVTYSWANLIEDYGTSSYIKRSVPFCCWICCLICSLFLIVSDSSVNEADFSGQVIALILNSNQFKKGSNKQNSGNLLTIRELPAFWYIIRSLWLIIFSSILYFCINLFIR